MEKITSGSRMFWLCLVLIVTGSTVAFSQVGADKKANAPPPKKGTTTPAKKATPTPRSSKTNRGKTNSSLSNLPPTRTNQAGIEFVLVPPGSFMMGSISEDSVPVHQVTIKYPFYMGKYEVTQAQWQAIMGNNPSYFKGDNLPVERVSWQDANSFVARLNAQNDGFTYRLPTEAEWEYACRAGTTGDVAGALEAMAWYGNNSGRARLDANALDAPNYYKRIIENGGQTHPVGTKSPNKFGLFDMYGNVSEWCQDWYHETYEGAPTDGSAWVTGDELAAAYRVLRGGSWTNSARYLTSAWRTPDSGPTKHEDSIYGTIGFRVVAIVRNK